MQNEHFERLEDELPEVTAALLLTYLELGLTFLESARSTRFDVVNEHHLAKSQKAFETVTRLLPMLPGRKNYPAIEEKLIELGSQLNRAQTKAKAAGA